MTKINLSELYSTKQKSNGLKYFVRNTRFYDFYDYDFSNVYGTTFPSVASMIKYRIPECGINDKVPHSLSVASVCTPNNVVYSRKNNTGGIRTHTRRRAFSRPNSRRTDGCVSHHRI